jgi:N-acetyl-alpha-D-muramate 1-phosphate uridylyltransferase
MPDKAMVFAAGLGTRMRPITDTIPKPLVSVAGKPLIDHTLDRLAEAGIETAVVNVHYRAAQIEAHLATRERPRIIISDERAQLLDQGGGLRKALPLLGEQPVLISNTDAFWVEGPKPNLPRFAAGWDAEQMDILLLVAATSASVGVDWLGDFTMDASGRLKGREERRVAPFVYTGVGIIKPQLFQDRTEDVFRLAPYFHKAAAAGRLFGARLDGLWFHVGTPGAIDEAERTVARSIL